MSKVKPIVANTPEELAGISGLPPAVAKKGRVRYALQNGSRKSQRVRKLTHAQIAAKAGTSRTRVTAILNDDLGHVSRPIC